MTYRGTAHDVPWDGTWRPRVIKGVFTMGMFKMGMFTMGMFTMGMFTMRCIQWGCS
jgi:hypothetical protein